MLTQLEAHFGGTLVWKQERSGLTVAQFTGINGRLEPESVVFATAGMSNRRMPGAPAGSAARIELMIALPGGWQKIFEVADPSELFAVDTLKVCANYPFQYNTWLGGGHTLPAGRPLCKQTAMAGWVFTNDLLFEDPAPLKVEGEPVELLLMTPLYPLELSLAQSRGTDALMDRLFRMVGTLQQDWSFFAAPKRPDTVGGGTIFV